jgi:predicted MPP superfamily phosphohydrolase
LILVTGDFIEDKFDPRPALPVMRRYLEKLQSIAPVVGCLGNHDGDLLAPHLIDAGVRVLLNEIHCVTCSGIPIEIIGAAGVARVDLDVPRLEAQLATRSSPDPINAAAGQGVRIILSHYPDAIHALAKLKPDIVLAGHTHGGQVCLPGGRPIITHDSLPLEHTTGLTTPEGVMLSISRGLGMSTYRIRLFCPSEFTRLSIRIQAGESF